MEITRDFFLEKKMRVLCHHCFRYKRIKETAEKELPEKGLLYEMEEQFENIVIRES